MKYIAAILLFALMISGTCEKPSPKPVIIPNEASAEVERIDITSNIVVYKFTVDSCEYLVTYATAYNTGVTTSVIKHKDHRK